MAEADPPDPEVELVESSVEDFCGGIIQLLRKLSNDLSTKIDLVKNLKAWSLSITLKWFPAVSSHGSWIISDNHLIAPFQAFCLGFAVNLSQLSNSSRIKTLEPSV